MDQYVTETQKLEQEAEQLLEHLAEVHQQERTARLHGEEESQANRWTLNREQEERVQPRQSVLSSSSLRPSWDEAIHPERPEELRQRGWNSKQNQQRTAVPSGLGASLRE